jgi:hypothetical protein
MKAHETCRYNSKIFYFGKEIEICKMGYWTTGNPGEVSYALIKASNFVY